MHFWPREFRHLGSKSTETQRRPYRCCIRVTGYIEKRVSLLEQTESEHHGEGYRSYVLFLSQGEKA